MKRATELVNAWIRDGILPRPSQLPDTPALFSGSSPKVWECSYVPSAPGSVVYIMTADMARYALQEDEPRRPLPVETVAYYLLCGYKSWFIHTGAQVFRAQNPQADLMPFYLDPDLQLEGEARAAYMVADELLTPVYGTEAIRDEYLSGILSLYQQHSERADFVHSYPLLLR